MIVLDTNVLSEMLRTAPADPVKLWVKAQLPNDLYTTAICEAEMLYGLALMPTGRRRTTLERAVEAIFAEDFAGRILTFDSAAAKAFARIASERRRSGRPISDFDAQIAAIAASQRAAVATRNVDDFVDCGVGVISPWEG
jgi:predicted nucleic acid-binding protein